MEHDTAKMEVEGKREGDITYAKTRSFFCHSCGDEGKQNEAEGFCHDCQEYLCKECCEFHGKVRVTKGHTITDKNNMPAVETRPAAVCSEKCKQHKTEIVKFFCKGHNAVGCGDCIVIEHKQCTVEHIQELAYRFLDSEEYRELIAKFEDIQTRVTNKENKLRTETTKVEESYNRSINELRKFRQTINEYLDQAEQDLLVRCEQRKQETDSIVRQQEEQLQTIKQKLNDMMAALKLKEANVADLFVEAKRTMANLRNLEEDLSSASEEPGIEEMCFQESDALKNIVQQEGIGTVSRRRNTADKNPVAAGSINMKSPDDKKDCRITSMAVTASGDILCTDLNNNAIKVIDTKKNLFTLELSLSSGPWSITALADKGQYAATLPGKKRIQFIKYEKELSTEGSISTDGECRGIAYHEQKLIVSYPNHPPKLQVLSLEGNVFLTVDNRDIFTWPHYVSVDHRDGTVFVSDHSKHSVIKMTIDGSILATYVNSEFRRPRGLFLCKDGQALVCRDRDSGATCKDSCIYLLSSSCSKIKILLKDDDRLSDPLSVCFNELINHMYVSNFYSDCVLVYGMH